MSQNNSGGALALTTAGAIVAKTAGLRSGTGLTIASVSGSSATVATISTAALTSMATVAAPVAVIGVIAYFCYKASK